MTDKKDFYHILGVPENASQEDIKKAYRRLAHQHHPDRKDGSEAKFKEINTAYQTLSDPEKRARYDNLRRYGPAFGREGFGPGGGFKGGGFGPFEFQFDFSRGAPGGNSAFEDLLREFFVGFGAQTKTRPQTNAKISTSFTFHGSGGVTLYLEVSGPKELSSRARSEVERLGSQLTEILVKEFGK